MMDGEKRIVTFMGDAGRRTASIIWRDRMNMFEVFCENDYNKLSKFFTLESEAQTFAEEFVWEKKYGTV
jgi:hypothetical protein